jgi:hypothetical protein
VVIGTIVLAAKRVGLIAAAPPQPSPVPAVIPST